MRRTWTVLLLCAAAGCASDDPAREPDRPPPRAADEAPASGAERISIPAPVMAQLDAWTAKDATLIGEVVEVDATRIPFSEGQIAVEASRETDGSGKRLIERTETTDPATRIVTLTLVNRSGMKTVRSLLPGVRVGGARLFLATDRLVLRYVPGQGAARPVSLTAIARGNARLLEGEPSRKVAGSSIRVGAEIVRGAAGYEFRPLEERQP
jgi:hypothetical protein